MSVKIVIPLFAMKLENEATLQAEFYHACRLLDMTAVSELVTPVGRLDVVILSPDKKRLLAIVEVKEFEHSFIGGQSAQIVRYKRLGVPVYGLWIGKDPHRLAGNIKAAVQNSEGRPLSELEAQRCFAAKVRAIEKETRKAHRLARFKKYHPNA